MRASPIQSFVLLSIAFCASACSGTSAPPPPKLHKITVTTLEPTSVTLTHRFVGRIESHHHIEIRAPEPGFIAAIQVKDGQAVKRNDVLFQLKPRTDKEKGDKLVPVMAPFDGVIDSLPHPKGSPVHKGATLTALYDNTVMWVYFNVPEAQYLKYKADRLEEHKHSLKIELMLANDTRFDQPGKLGAIGAQFDAGSVKFRADFPNPARLLRHGGSGIVLVSQVKNDVIVVPQPATFRILDKTYVFVVDENDVARQREIVIQNELEDQLIVKAGVGANDKIINHGIHLVHDGEKVRY